MAKVNIPLEHVDETVVRLAVKSVIDQLIYLTDMHVQDVIYQERGNIAATSRLNIDNEPLKLSSSDYVIVEYDSVPDPAAIDPDRNTIDYRNIFNAAQLGISMNTLHVKDHLNISISLRYSSWNKLSGWLSRLRQQLVVKAGNHYHDLIYNYAIPIPIIAYLSNVHTAVNTVDSLNVNIPTFLSTFFATGLLVRHNISDTSKQVVMNIKNSGCLGMFTEIPKVINTNKDEGYSEIKFEYVLQYDRPVSIRLDYQMFIHNQKVPTDMFRHFQTRTLSRPPYQGMSTFSGSVNLATGTMGPYVEPSSVYLHREDTWHPTISIPKMTPILITPIQLDLNTPNNLFNLNDLLGPTVTSELLNIITDNGMDLIKPFYSPYHLEMWAVTDTVKQIELTMDPALNVSFIGTPNFRARYYLKFSLVNDLSMVDIEKYYDQPDTLLFILSLLKSDIELIPYKDIDNVLNIYGILLGTDTQLLTRNGGAFVTLDSLVHVIKGIKQTNDSYKQKYGVRRLNNVQISTVLTKLLNTEGV